MWMILKFKKKNQCSENNKKMKKDTILQVI